MNDLYGYDAAMAGNGAVRIAGVDEAGRGPLAGPVVAAAVVLNPDGPIDGVNDSKKLTAARRDALYGRIIIGAKAYGVGISPPEEIDAINILQATFLAMKRALAEMEGGGGDAKPYDLLLIDGNQYVPGIPREIQRVVVGGDAKSASVAAASILAKVTRDRIMEEYHVQYPQYGFDKHKGYGTKYHQEMIIRHGLCAIHRRTFCENIVMRTDFLGDLG
ncbi:MAG: ribonuclease HII [Chitinispirillia bacterium]|nr:ribonuclease HII [Chitinispirillia bacterium]MCL2241583.1 ribonuclease HII [Chitinispirillia bacterium]